MKLRYYMRGLGIGILVTAFIMGISSPQRSMANDDPDSQLAESGTADSQAVMLADLASDPAEPTPASETDSDSEPADTPAATPASTPAQTPAKTSTPTPSPEPSQDNASGQETESAVITFTIENGTGSETVSKKLEEAGLIENASSFNRFLCDNGYSKSIRAGEFEIPAGADENEIAGIITGKR